MDLDAFKHKLESMDPDAVVDMLGLETADIIDAFPDLVLNYYAEQEAEILQ